MEKPDRRECDGEMGEQDDEGALPLGSCIRDLVLLGLSELQIWKDQVVA
jgi:hypothetical protein